MIRTAKIKQQKQKTNKNLGAFSGKHEENRLVKIR